MTREQSWQVRGVTLSVLRQIAGFGYTVSVFRFPPSRSGRPGFIEMQALGLAVDPVVNHVARVSGDEDGDVDYRCACALAQLVGIDLRDG